MNGPTIVYSCRDCHHLYGDRWCTKLRGQDIIAFQTPDDCPYPHNVLKEIRKYKLHKLNII